MGSCCQSETAQVRWQPLCATLSPVISSAPLRPQLFATAREANGAPVAAWRTAWRQLAVAHAIGWAASAAAAWSAGKQQGSSSGSSETEAALTWLAGNNVAQPLALSVGWQLLWAGAAGLAAAAGLPAMLAALSSQDIGSSSGGRAGSTPAELEDAPSQRQVQLCSTATGLAAVVLQAAYWLMGQWARCFAFLLAALPLYGLAAQQSPSWLCRAAALTAVAALAGAAAAGQLPAWLWGSVLPHCVVAALAVL